MTRLLFVWPIVAKSDRFHHELLADKSYDHSRDVASICLRPTSVVFESFADKFVEINVMTTINDRALINIGLFLSDAFATN
jgi:hypothetical protein